MLNENKEKQKKIKSLFEKGKKDDAINCYQVESKLFPDFH